LLSGLDSKRPSDKYGSWILVHELRANPALPRLIEGYFTERLMRRRKVSANTIASQGDAFLLFSWV
jgi:hypothetical protein